MAKKGSKKNYKPTNLKTYSVGIKGSTIPFSERYSVDSCIGYLVPYYFRVFKVWAILTHESLKEWRELQKPNLYKTTFQGYCAGKFRVVSLNRLFLYFSYFRYNTAIFERLKSEGIDLSTIDFWQFLRLENIPLPDGEVLNVPIIWGDLIPRKYVQLPDNQEDINE